MFITTGYALDDKNNTLRLAHFGFAGKWLFCYYAERLFFEGFNEMDEKKSFAAFENLAVDKVFNEEVAESLDSLFIILVHAVALNRRKPRTIERFRKILCDAKLSEEHLKKCKACKKTAKEFVKGFHLGI